MHPSGRNVWRNCGTSGTKPVEREGNTRNLNDCSPWCNIARPKPVRLWDIIRLRRHLPEGFTRCAPEFYCLSIIIELEELLQRQPGPGSTEWHMQTSQTYLSCEMAWQESLEHIQARCPVPVPLTKPKIAVHHEIWTKLLTAISRNSIETNDERSGSFPQQSMRHLTPSVGYVKSWCTSTCSPHLIGSTQKLRDFTRPSVGKQNPIFTNLKKRIRVSSASSKA